RPREVSVLSAPARSAFDSWLADASSASLSGRVVFGGRVLATAGAVDLEEHHEDDGAEERTENGERLEHERVFPVYSCNSNYIMTVSDRQCRASLQGSPRAPHGVQRRVAGGRAMNSQESAQARSNRALQEN